jgi:cellulose synthase/poly-beta-1,6-N-acetylglucosamine synthase-like glycosyltransferase
MIQQTSAEDSENEETKAEFDPRIVASLSKTGLITRVESANGWPNQYVLTPEGAQFVADYEKLLQASTYSSNGTMPPTRFRSSALTVQEMIEVLSLLEKRAFIEEHSLGMSQACLIIPALNEAENLHDLLTELASVIPEISQVLVVDGGSTDSTASIASALGARVITQKGFGKGDALRQAFGENFETSDKNVIILMDADGSNRPEEIPQLIAAVANGADIAKGSRFLKGGGSTDLSLVRRIGNKFFISIVNFAWKGKYTDLCYGFMALRKDALLKLRPLLKSQRFQIETELCIKAKKLAMNVVEIPSIELRRRNGISKLIGFRDSTQIFRTIVRELLLD